MGMLVNLKKVLVPATKKGYAVGAFNFNNLEFLQAILEAAE
ncbi:MAG: class II fructose-bisphosphate aldolase, partial [Patescibacteria group bacterium]